MGMGQEAREKEAIYKIGGLRDQVIIAAINGSLASGCSINGMIGLIPKDHVELAIAIADEMIKARKLD